MVQKYTLIFDKVMIAQLKKLGEDQNVRNLLVKMFDKMEILGPRAGDLIDSQLFLYEMKSKHPPLRLYYWHNKINDELYVFEYEMKTSSHKQEKTISKLKRKLPPLRNQGLSL